MQIYLVGGAVRDQLLGLPVHERDWVVVGATPDALLAKGYRPVGKDFPVFLHPDTHEEYALARTERKIGLGYKGFTCYAAPDVTLEDDLKRRDLTINAMAQDQHGQIIDPYGGQTDLAERRLRHVSPAFSEDPVRILRVARFAAKFPAFTVDPQTNQLMRDMVNAGEVDALVPERVWQEWVKALAMPAPHRFIAVLADCGAWATLFPEIDPAGPGVFALQHAITAQDSLPIRFALLTHPLSETALSTLCQRLKPPNAFKQLATQVSYALPIILTLEHATSNTVLALLLRCNALRNPEHFNDILTVITHILCLNEKNSSRAQHYRDQLQQAAHLVQAIDVTPLLAQGFTGKALAVQLEQERLAVLTQLFKSQ